MSRYIPTYKILFESGELAKRVDQLESMLSSCTICPHLCGNNRLENELARCYSGYLPVVSSYCRHMGEEPVLTGKNGVGNIFLGNCNLRCVYCQNHEISQNWRIENSKTVSIQRLAEIIIELQEMGCHSIGFVSPTHFVPQIVKAVSLAIPLGLRIPLIYNTNAYDSVDVLRLLNGIIDIYLPDIKYSEDTFGYSYSKVPHYVKTSREAIKEMYSQVGSDLAFDSEGILLRGLIIRHLVLPNDLASSEETFRWIVTELDPRVALSVMAQYYPVHKAVTTELLDRGVRESEYEKVLSLLDRYGLDHGWVQEYESREYYQPDFQNRLQPFTV
jgi:putative pyruvate formate lyase activating enzyme